VVNAVRFAHSMPQLTDVEENFDTAYFRRDQTMHRVEILGPGLLSEIFKAGELSYSDL